MNHQTVFPVSIFMSFTAFGLLVMLYLPHAFNTMGALLVLQILVALHVYRFVGLAFLMPGVVSDDLPSGFSKPAAYGDLIAAVLAAIVVLMLHEHIQGALFVTWIFNVWGTVDLLIAMYQGVRRIGMSPQGPGLLGATFFIPTVYVPALLITHGLIFWLLLSERVPLPL